ncbi:hypothetical protein J437_LFUL019080 [Ladona fulva]|uniref:Uncharacterized protein n=1 Tax=Ladona fulva TaxID=123851 RepID=A0A8K0KT07_LADFU|nr:hypothetical protein J437_LFUL019080 [Ladona fulva]
MYSRAEEERLAWHKFYQSKLLRVASRQELDETTGAKEGPKIAKIPSEDEADGRLRKLVLQHMLHGPCGDDKPNAPCMDSKRKTCSKGFPKPTCEVTYIDDRGYKNTTYFDDDNMIYLVNISY